MGAPEIARVIQSTSERQMRTSPDSSLHEYSAGAGHCARIGPAVDRLSRAFAARSLPPASGSAGHSGHGAAGDATRVGIDALHTFRHPAALIKIGMRRITASAVSAQVLPRRCDLADHPLLQLALILRGELQARVDT